MALNSVFKRRLALTQKNKDGFGRFVGDSAESKIKSSWMSKVSIFHCCFKLAAAILLCGCWRRVGIRNSNERIPQV